MKMYISKKKTLKDFMLNHILALRVSVHNKKRIHNFLKMHTPKLLELFLQKLTTYYKSIKYNYTTDGIRFN